MENCPLGLSSRGAQIDARDPKCGRGNDNQSELADVRREAAIPRLLRREATNAAIMALAKEGEKLK